MRISDWSSDVCSSDLHLLARHEGRPMTDIRALGYLKVQSQDIPRWRELTVDCLAMQETTGSDPDGLYLRMDERAARLVVVPGDSDRVLAVGWAVRDQFALASRSEERRVGKECVSTCRSRG